MPVRDSGRAMSGTAADEEIAVLREEISLRGHPDDQ